jgi:twitching motility protein PilT
MKEDIRKILIEMRDKRASDLHVTAHSPMHYRIDDQLVPIGQPLAPDAARDMIYGIMDAGQIEKFEKEKELDFSFEIEGVGRYRVNVFFQRAFVGCAVRLIPLHIMSIPECGLPVELVKSFCHMPKGLILVTGATGSGKSTTLAAMLDEINSTRRCHMITVEDPIEFVHKNKKAIIDQRQVYNDTDSFYNALRHVLRQDPDVIMIGELRDLETIQQALIIADTGHLVLGTLHTSDCVQTINRIVDVFPAHQQKQIRFQLSFVLLGILSQQLVPRKDSVGLVLASEILVATPAVRSMIRETKEHQLYSILQTSQREGMKTMNSSLVELYKAGKIEYADAVARTSNVEELAKMAGKPWPAE